MLPYFSQVQTYNVVDNISSHEIVAQVNIDSDEEELVYNGKVYLDEDEWNLDPNEWNSDFNEWNPDPNEWKNGVPTEKIKDEQVKTEKIDVLNNVDVIDENAENISSLEESEEEEIIFHDDFDTGYREELEEIWGE